MTHEDKQKALAVKVKNCARCGKDHGMEFYMLDRPIDLPLSRRYTHWGTCPNTQAPVLMAMRTD